jgi:MOSC domain-containing protein YiiM
VSGGGVPKLPVPNVEVDLGGVVGDRQAARVHHGRPWQALCLWSQEVIDGLAADGHPIGLGSAGENVTVSGIAWPDVTPGVRLRLGPVVLCQVMAYALPCKKNARWFSDGDFNRIHHLRGQLSRVYAVVLEPGAIVAGDTVTLEP